MSSAAFVHDLPLVVRPTTPHSLADTGLSFDLVEQLLLKMLHFSGELSGAALSQRLRLAYSALAPVLEHVKQLHLVEVFGSGMIAGPEYVYRITDAGRSRALLFLEQSHYVGPAPVPFAQYEKFMQSFAQAAPRSATRERVRQAFSSLVLGDRVLSQLGPAVNGGHSMFVYGPPGNGKTVISQAIRNLLDGELPIPYAIEAHGQIIQVYDAVAHEALPAADSSELGIDVGSTPDARWVRCKRPLVMVGGELRLEQLDLHYGETSKFYQAPVQMVANGGVLVIDDFGRQQCTPAELLNRWITPLESRVDYLSLQTGQKLPMPFVVLVVFATNIKPSELVDEAFLRRIHYKVFAESPTLDQFKEIFRRCCADRDVPYDDALIDQLVAEEFEPRGIALRGCHPRDLLSHVLAFAEYLDHEPRMTEELLKMSFETYFVDERAVKRIGR